MAEQGPSIKEQIKMLEVEHEKLKKRQEQMLKQMTASIRSNQALVDYSDTEIAKSQSEPDPDRRARLVRLNELRKRSALSNIELIELIGNLKLAKKISPQVTAQIELLALRGQYISTEYHLTNYEPIMNLLVPALENPTPAAPADEKPGTAPLQRGGPAATPRPGVPGARPGVPGAARPGAPGVPAPARPAMPARPGVPNRPVPGAGTGPLAQRAAAAAQQRAPGTGTGPLAARAAGNSGPLAKRAQTGNLNKEAEIKAAIYAAVQDPAQKLKLQDLVNRVRDLEFSMQPLRGFETGDLAMPIEQAAGPIRQNLGKVYYINRVISQLGPLGQLLSFNGEPPDPAVEKMLSTIEEAPDEADEAEETTAAAEGPSLSSMLKSLFKT